MNEVKFNLHSDRVLRAVFTALLAMDFGFVLLDLIFNYSRLIPAGAIQRLFNIAREDSLASWVSSVQTLFVGLILWLVFAANRKKAWAAIAAFFTYLGIDDGSKLYERVGTAVKQLSGSLESVEATGAVPHSYTWQYIFVPFFAAFGFFILIYLWRELKTNRERWVLFAALACYGLAVGLDFIEGLPEGYDTIATYVGVSGRFMNHFGRVLEEFLELLGTSLFLVTFLGHLLQVAPKWSLSFHEKAPR
jgi:hypothetical protein